MYSNLATSLDRADLLVKELEAEYNNSLESKTVSPQAVQLTHDICEKLRGILDRVARRYWELCVSPDLSEDDRSKAAVYFPIVNDSGALDSVLGRWRWKSVRAKHQKIYSDMLALQPFTNADNKWLEMLNELAVEGKHIDLVPQKKFEEKRTTVSRGSSSVSWTGGVKFSGNVSVMGVPIDPATQRIIPTEGVTEKIEIWVSFNIEGYNVNALGFCQDACSKVRKITSEISDKYGL